MDFDYIRNEYGWIENQFGKQGVDWTREFQSLVEDNGRFLDKIRIRLIPDGRMYDVIFDVTGPYVENVADLRSKLQGNVGSGGQLGVANAFPAVQGDTSAQSVLQDCERFFQQGILDHSKGTFNDLMVTPEGADWPESRLDLYRVVYRLGRYGEVMGWPESKKQSWAHEVGRAVASGMDDSLAGRGMSGAYAPYDSSIWSQDDRAAITNAYYAGYKEGDGLRKKSKLGTWIMAGLVAFAGVAGVVYWQSRKSSAVHPLEEEIYDNPAQMPMTVQTLLFDKELWSVDEAKDWAKEHGNRYGSVDVKGRNIRLRQNDPSAFHKGSYATIPFGEGTGIQAVVARPKR